MKAWDPDLKLKLANHSTGVELRDHQKKAHDALTKYFLDAPAAPSAKGKAGLVLVPTGGGKTMLAAHWLLNEHVANGGRVVWFAHRRSLVRQAFETFRRIANVIYPRKDSLELIAISSGWAKWSQATEQHDVVFSTMQSAVLEGNLGFLQKLHEDSAKGLFIVLDEAHHAPAPQSYRLLKMLKEECGCPLIGLTATPVKQDDEDQKRLSALFDQKVVYQISRKELTERGILAVPAFETVKTNVAFEREFTASDYKYLERYGELGPQVLDSLAKHAGRNQLIVDHYVKGRGTYGPTIVFAANTLHAQTLAETFQKSGVSADYVDYSRDNAQEIILNYQQKKQPDVLVNVEMLTEGFDAPHTRTVFIARPTRSEALLTQMVGRALRGKASNGNDKAYLVTFLDTWDQFNVMDAEYALGEPVDIEVTVEGRPSTVRIAIPPELVREAHRLLQSNVKGQLEGVFQCLPYGWYTWEEEFENDLQRRSVMVFDNQRDGYAALFASFASPEQIPQEISEDLARDFVRKFFADAPDPLPRWADVVALLDAKRKGCAIHQYTFEEKSEFDPKTLAQSLVELPPKQIVGALQKLWDEKPACRAVYRDDFKAFHDDVSREINDLVSPAPPPVPPEVEKIVPTQPPRAWAEGERGYSLVELRDGVLSIKKNFPNGSPHLGDLRWSKRPMPGLWGFCRYSDKSITINCVLNSPDVPRYVMEFLMFHEMLHADMPSSGHNPDFRLRERGFEPSVAAVEEAAKLGIVRGAKSSADFWRVRADNFLDTFQRYYAHKKPGAAMNM